MNESKSKEIRTGENHLIVTGLVNGEREERIVKKAIKKAVRKLRKLNDGRTTFEAYISNRNNSHQEG